MNSLRLPQTLVSCFFLLAALVLPLGAQTISWTGLGSTNDVTDNANWSAPITPGADVIFGVTGNYEPFIPTGGAELHDITFNGTGRGEYEFTGTSGSMLVFTGDMDVTTPGDISFRYSLGLLLTGGDHTINIASNTTVYAEGNIAETSGSGSISVTGNGTLVLEGTNTFSGGFTVNSGSTILLSTDSSVDGNPVQIYSSPVGLGTLNLKNGSTVTVYEEYSRELANDIALDPSGGTVYFDIPDYSDLQVSGYISGNAGISKSGSGTLVLTNALSDFSGGMSVHGGELMLAASSDTEGSTVINGPVGTGALKLYGGTTLSTAFGPITLHNDIELDCNAANVVHVSVGTGDTLELTGTISGEAKFAKIGAGTLDLYGSNTFTGPLATGSSGGSINIHGNTSAGLGGVQLGDYTGINFLSSAPAINGLQGSSYTSVTLASGSTLTINQAGAGNFGGTINATTASVVKSGPGIQIFSGANNYSGGTTITGGVLIANHGNGSNVVDALGTGAVTLNGGILKIGDGLTFGNALNFGGSGGTLGGNGIFSSPLTLGANVTLSPGNSPGTMTFAAGLTANNGLITNIEINGATNNPGVNSDLIVVNGSGLNLNSLSPGGYTLRIISLSLLNGDTSGPVDGLTGGGSWTIFQTSGVFGFAANKFVIDQTNFVTPGAFVLTQVGTDLVLTFTPVPEPSTYVLIGLGIIGGGLASWRRRRRV